MSSQEKSALTNTIGKNVGVAFAGIIDNRTLLILGSSFQILIDILDSLFYLLFPGILIHFHE